MNEHIHLLLLEILSRALSGQDAGRQDVKSVSQEVRLDKDTLRRLTEDAIHHSVLPLVMDTFLQDRPAGNRSIPVSGSGNMLDLYRNEIIRQAQKTADFLLFYEYLSANDLHPLVLKGIICRDIYPQPEHRASSDEDLLIDSAEFGRYHEVILAYGLSLVDPAADIWNADEVSYENRENHLYIEVHKSLFDPKSKTFASLNDCFEGILQRSVTKVVYGTTFHTPAPTDHLLYLFLHAFKHFLYSGFGIRQVCDIVMFAEHYRSEIDWPLIKDRLEKVSAFEFTKAVFKIGDRYLLRNNHLKECFAGWGYEKIDEGPLLSDIMDGGIYGVEDINRAHAANITLHAAGNNKTSTCKKLDGTLFHTFFLPLSAMRNRFRYLNNAPFLLPFAWVQRLVLYILKDSHTDSKNNDIIETIRIGSKRISLLRQYHIID